MGTAFLGEKESSGGLQGGFYKAPWMGQMVGAEQASEDEVRMRIRVSGAAWMVSVSLGLVLNIRNRLASGEGCFSAEWSTHSCAAVCSGCVSGSVLIRVIAL